MMASRKKIYRTVLSPEQVAALLGQYVAAKKGPENAGKTGRTHVEVIFGVDKKGQHSPAQYRVEVTVL